MIQAPFQGNRLRYARLLAAKSLDELGEAVGVSRQYLHQLETGAKLPSSDLRLALEDALGVTKRFFSLPLSTSVAESDCHFRKLRTASRVAMSHAAARGTLVEQLATVLDSRLRLPVVDFPDFGQPNKVIAAEKIATATRMHWSLSSDAPISNITRVLERAGALVVSFPDISDRVDALSISRRRPIIVRSSTKTAAVRLRFDLAHECGHLIMHNGIMTGDHETEEQAHRFASAFLFPAEAFFREFPRVKRMDWSILYALKVRWGMSMRAMVRRAYDLEIIDSAQYRVANINLVKSGQGKSERGDDVLIAEQPELVISALRVLEQKNIASYHHLLAELGLRAETFGRLMGVEVPSLPINVEVANG